MMLRVESHAIGRGACTYAVLTWMLASRSVGGVEEIDTVMKLGMAHPMGPLQLADFIGLDVCVAILDVLHKGLGDPKYAACPLLVNMVEAGHLGVKSGVGFYKYEAGSKELIVADRFASGQKPELV